MRILLVEDDESVAGYWVRGLVEAGHTVDVGAEGRAALVTASTESFDLLVAGRMLPGLDGLSLVRALRANGDQIPVLFLSALASVDHRVEGFEGGGDDYLTKPFSFSELLARVEALHRRHTQEPVATELVVGELTMILLARSVRRGAVVVDLQPREYQLLEYLMRHAGQVVTRTMLLEKVWDYNFDPQTNVIDVHISRLRKKVGKSFSSALIHTVREVGYVLRTTS